MNMSGHDANLDLVRGDQPGAIRPDQQGAFTLHLVTGAQHVVYRNTLGDTDHQIDIRLDRLIYRRCRTRWRHIDYRHCRTCCLFGIAHRGNHRDIFEQFACFFRIHSGNETIRSVRIGFAIDSVELAYLAGHPLRHYSGVFINQNRHYASLAAATTFSAASAISLPEMIGRPDSARIFLPSSTFVPSRRTTSGTLRCTSRAAATTPSAITSHLMMPPKMFTRIALRLGLCSISLNASVTFSLLAPPPTSRKFAGLPPYSLMMSMVALSLIHISEPTRLGMISYAVFC